MQVENWVLLGEFHGGLRWGIVALGICRTYITHVHDLKTLGLIVLETIWVADTIKYESGELLHTLEMCS